MSNIQRLIRVAARRNSAKEYTTIRFRVLRELLSRFKEKTVSEGISCNVVFEAFLNGYVNSHPSVLSMIDQWMRDENQEIPERKVPKMSREDLDEIYKAAQGGMELEENSDG